MAIEATLAELGQNIVKAYSGREALRCLLKDDFAVILLDVNMPEMDGFETAALIRERKRSEHTPIIFVTAFNDEVQMAKGYSLGAVDFISTPIDPEVIAHQGRRVRRSLPKDGDNPPAGGPSRSIGPRASGPASGRKGDAALRAVGRGEPAVVAFARFRRDAY